MFTNLNLFLLKKGKTVVFSNGKKIFHHPGHEEIFFILEDIKQNYLEMYQVIQEEEKEEAESIAADLAHYQNEEKFLFNKLKQQIFDNHL